MIGAIGAILFGAVFAGSWMVAEDREQKSKEVARETKNKLYYDKNRRLRNVQTGKKATDEEIHEYFFGGYEKRRREFKDTYDLNYWGFRRFEIINIKTEYGTTKNVLNFINKPVLEVFDNYNVFKNEYDKMKNYYIANDISALEIHKSCDGINGNNKLSKSNIDGEKIWGCKIHYNF